MVVAAVVYGRRSLRHSFIKYLNRVDVLSCKGAARGLPLTREWMALNRHIAPSSGAAGHLSGMDRVSRYPIPKGPLLVRRLHRPMVAILSDLSGLSHLLIRSPVVHVRRPIAPGETRSRWQRGQPSPNAGTRYRRPNYLRCSHSFRNATATANALKNAKMVANIG